MNEHTFNHVTVGVANLDTALTLWCDTFGLNVVAQQAGADAALERLWNLPSGAVTGQALLFTPGVASGGLHLVEFSAPGEPVRDSAEVFDLLPKSIDVYCSNLPERYEELRTAGFEFRARWTEMHGPGKMTFREVQMFAHDRINIALLEVLGVDYPFGPKGYAAVGPLVTAVASADEETAFYEQILGLNFVLGDLISGPEIETMIGLPAGAGLDYRVLGDPDNPMGRMEVIEYQQTAGRNRYARTAPPALGTLHVNWAVDSMQALLDRLEAAGIDWHDHGPMSLLYGNGQVISFQSPAGMRQEVIAPE